MYRYLSLATLLAFLAGNPTCARAADDEDPLRPVQPVVQVKIADLRNYGSGGSFMLSPDGKTLVSAMHNSVTLYDLSSPGHASEGRHLALGNRYFQGSAIALSPDGKLLAALGAQHEEDQTVHFFDLQTGKEVRQIDNDQHFFTLAFSADGKTLALANQQRVELWDAVSGDEFRVIPGEQNTVYHALAFSADGKMLAAVGAESAIQVWEVVTGKERCRFQAQVEVPENRRYYGPGGQSLIPAIAFARDGWLLAAGCADNTVRLWDIRTGRELPPLSGHLGAVCALTFTPDGKRLVSFDTDGLKLAWSVRSIERSPVDRLPKLTAAAVDETWNDLADADAFHIYHAVRYLAADPDQTLPLLNRHLRPVPAGDPKRLAQLVTDLQNPKAGVRRNAMTALRKEGEAALGALAKASGQGQGNPNLAFNARVARFQGGAFQPNGAIGPLMRKLETECASPERSRSIKAVQVLEQIDNEQARALLQKLAKGAAGARLTVAAGSALERMTSRKKSGRAAADAGKQPLGAGEPDALWASLGSADAATAFKAMRSLWSNPGPAITLLQNRVQPGSGPNLSRLPQLITALDDGLFTEREAATKALSELGKLAEPALRDALAHSGSPEARRRLEQLLERCDQAVPAESTLRALRAIEVLEQMDAADARPILERLSKGSPTAGTTREARAALERVAQRVTVSR